MLNLEPIKQRLNRAKYKTHDQEEIIELYNHAEEDLSQLIAELEYLRDEYSVIKKAKRACIAIITEAALSLQYSKFNIAKSLLFAAIAADDDEIYWENLPSVVQELRKGATQT